MLLHIGAFHLDIDSQRVTPWHNLTPRVRVLCTVILVFAIVLTPNAHWRTWGIYGFSILSLVWLSQVTLGVLLKRLALEFTFIGVVLLGTLFRDGGKILWAWGPIKITTLGLTILGSVSLKAILSLLILNVLTLTTSVPVLLQSMIELRVPPLLVAILSSMYRYISVLVNEFNAMRRAAASRNLMSNKRWQRLVMGNMIGSLFIRTYGRGERVYHAMISRGYQGIPLAEKVLPTRQVDIVALTLTAILVLLGQAIYLF